MHPETVALRSAQVGDDRVEVASGECARFDATHAHAYDNPGPVAARFTLVVLDPA